VTTRVHQLAQELGVKSTAIVEKCQKEGLDVKNHMSTLSAGLEATIREWFSEGEHVTTVETAAPVDLTKVKAKRSRSSRKAAAPKPEATEESSSAAVLETAPAALEETEAQKIPVTVIDLPAAEIPTAHKTSKPKRKSPKELAAGQPDVAGIEEIPQTEPEPPAFRAAQKADESIFEQSVQAEVQSPQVVMPPSSVPVAPVEPKPVKKFVPAPAQLQGPRVIRMERPDFVPGPPSRQRRPVGKDQPPEAPIPETAAQASKRRKSKRHVSVDDTAEAETEAGRSKHRPARHRGRRGHEVVHEVPTKHEWGDRDLLEREERLAQASGNQLRGRERRLAQQDVVWTPPTAPTKSHRIEKASVKEPITVKDLSAAIGVRVSEIIQKLMQLGVMATINQVIDTEAASTIAMEFGVELTVEAKVSLMEKLREEFDREAPDADRRSRPPVVAFLGHVDHGKTSLLDRIRKANIAAGEAGGITQHIGSYLYNDGKRQVTFLDTPGHKAFTAMRARGANMTDIVVLVVAADDGVMPQTEEAIDHAKAAGVPIVVAMNKIDLGNANENKVLGQLSEHGLVPTAWGGTTEIVRTSAVTGQGIDDLVEHLDYVAELNQLKARVDGPATGWVIESEMTTGQGVVARLLVKSGTLRPGDYLVSGGSYGKIRAVIDAVGKRLDEAGPSTPVEVTGLDGIPVAGDRFFVVESIIRAKEIAEESQAERREKALAGRRQITLENLFGEIAAGEIKELNIILKADVQGSVDVLAKTLIEMNTPEVAVRILHASVGGVTESDVLLAAASNAIIIGFNVVTDEHAKALAETEQVEIRHYRIIYQISDDLKKALEGMLSPNLEMKLIGQAEVRQVFRVSRIGAIAGCIVTQGRIHRSGKARLIRDSVVLRDEIGIESLRRGKDDSSEVRSGFECGIKLSSFDDIKIGDVIEVYEQVKISRTLETART
jgi:translation initiation factor IF-2